MGMRWMIGLWTVLFLIGGSGWTRAEGSELMESWSQQAERVDQLVREGNREEAREELSKLAKSFSQGDFSNVHLSVEGIGALSDTLVDLDRELIRAMTQPEKLNEASKRMRLAFDALAHPAQPLWQSYVFRMGGEIRKMKRGIKKDSPETVLSAANRLKADFRQIEPALWVSRKPEIAGAVQSYVESIAGQAGKEPLPMVPLQSALEQWEKMIRPSLLGKEEGVLAGAGEGPDWMKPAFIVGGVLLLALGYVGWRKYRVDRHEVVTLGRR
ncbi:hypothetical protein GCM10007416_09420 [Kroppenstedtia guangzhouensis]|uniref:Sporulation protein YpjB n=2 Tax=Kroppenstedtia guangzhouensis TaxID=1274356 RepID=A0ABQ1G845_9BACL|nr:hypothetical protein GCM10007416_09420 [Kroppenstedtia guangzhouensis]